MSWGHNGNTGGTLSQTFDTIVGTTYRVDYLLSLQQGGEPESMKVKAFGPAGLLNGGTLSNFTYSTWTAGSGPAFTAASPTTTLVFTDLGPSVFTNWGLDAVKVQPVPVPSALLLLGAGFKVVSE